MQYTLNKTFCDLIFSGNLASTVVILTAAHTMAMSILLFQCMKCIAVDLSQLSKIALTPLLVTTVVLMKGLVLIVTIKK